MAILDALTGGLETLAGGLSSVVDAASDVAGSILNPIQSIAGEVDQVFNFGQGLADDPVTALLGGGTPLSFLGGGGGLEPPAAVGQAAPFPQAEFLPQGAAVPAAMETGTIFDLVPPAMDALGQIMESGPGGAPMPGFLPSEDVFVPGNMAMRARRELHAINPATGAIHTYKNMGRPVLYSGDLAACKRVNKIARRARRPR